MNRSVFSKLAAKQVLHAEKRDSKMKSSTKQIARRRIQILFQLAKRVYRENPRLSNRYVAIARRVAMAARMPIPPEYKRQICKKCKILLVQGENCRVRIRPKREPHMVITCLSCGNKTRIPIKKKKE